MCFILHCTVVIFEGLVRHEGVTEGHLHESMFSLGTLGVAALSQVGVQVLKGVAQKELWLLIEFLLLYVKKPSFSE